MDRVSAMRSYCQDLVERHQPAITTEEKTRLLEILLQRDNFGYCSRKDWCEWASRILSQDLTADALWQDHQSHLVFHYPLQPEIHQLVEQLGENYHLAIISNGGSKNQRRKMERMGLSRYFSDIFISEEVGYRKPERPIFAAALQQVGYSAEECLMVGDDPMRDIEGATRMGIRTCWIAWRRAFPEGFPSPDYSLESVLELPGILSLESRL